MTRDDIIREILRLKGYAPSDFDRKKGLLDAVSDRDLWDSLVYEYEKAGQPADAVTPYPMRFSRGGTLTSSQAVKQQAKPQVAKAQAKPQATKSQAKPVKKSRRSRSAVPKALAKRVSRISRGIKCGRLSVKSGIKKPADYKGRMSRRERAEKFVKLYSRKHSTCRPTRRKAKV